jgi:hypothetical protein
VTAPPSVNDGVTATTKKAMTADPARKPPALPPNADGIPPELRARQQWVCWKWTWLDKEAKWSKVPFTAAGRAKASTTDPATWGTFTQATATVRAGRADGIGFVFTAQDPFFGLDLDECRDPIHEELSCDAEAVVQAFGTYTEVSPTGTGVKLIGLGKVPAGGNRKGDYEVYDNARYFALTGQRSEFAPAEIADCQAALNEFHAKYIAPPPAKAPQPAANGLVVALDLSDEDLLAKARAARNGALFEALYDRGDISRYDNDDSRADLALCGLLAFWTQGDAARIDNLFRGSALMREKWNRTDYRERTIRKAVTGRTEFYSGRRERGDDGDEEEDDNSPDDDKQSAAFDFIDARTFCEKDCRPSWLIRRLLVRGQPCVLGGPQKTLKTSVLIDMAVGMAAPCKTLGYFEPGERFRVGVLSGESGEAALQATYGRVCAARGVDPRTLPVFWGFRLPSLSDPRQLAALAARVRERQLDVLLFDPLYLALLSGVKGVEFDAKSLYDIGPLLMNFSQTMLAVGATPVLAHHFKHSRADQFAEPDLGDLTYGGIREYARQWVLLGRRSKYEHDGRHRLYLIAGGSIGHSYSYALDVNEGIMDADFGGRMWETTVAPAGDVRRHEKGEKEREKVAARSAAHLADEAALMTALDKLDPNGRGFGVERVRALAGLSRDKMAAAIERLAVQGLIRRLQVEVTVGSGASRSVDGIARGGDEEAF